MIRRVLFPFPVRVNLVCSCSNRISRTRISQISCARAPLAYISESKAASRPPSVVAVLCVGSEGRQRSQTDIPCCCTAVAVAFKPIQKSCNRVHVQHGKGQLSGWNILFLEKIFQQQTESVLVQPYSVLAQACCERHVLGKEHLHEHQ